jgi:rhamnosyltransferase
VTDVRISLIIPTLNGATTLPELFGALKVQSLVPYEILVIDSSAEDQTVSICRNAGATVMTIARESFDHGGTRTAAAKMAQGEILVFFTQDAILADRQSLQRLVEPLLQHDQVGCTYGRQLPARNADPIAAHLREYNYPAHSQCRSYADRLRYGLKTVFISNSFAAYRKKVLASCEYFNNGLIFGEDTCTLGRILLAGYRVCYVAEAEVYHSHNYSLIEDFRRAFDIGVLHKNQSWLLAAYGHAEGIGGRYVLSLVTKMYHDKRYLLLAECLMRSTLKFLGYKFGKNHHWVPTFLRSSLSMNRLWWRCHPALNIDQKCL